MYELKQWPVYFSDFFRSAKRFSEFKIICINFFQYVDWTIEGSDVSSPSLVGFSKSGLLLAHLYNIYKETIDRQVWLYRFFPSLAIYPCHQHAIDVLYDSSNTVVFDESVKTGLTASLYYTYLLSAFGDNVSDKKPFYLFTLTKDSSYDVIYDKQGSVFSLLTNDKKDGRPQRLIYRDEFDVNLEVDCFKRGLLPAIADVEVGKILNKFCESIDSQSASTSGDCQIDTHLFLTNTRFIVGRALYAAKRIEEIVESGDRRKLFFFSPSLEGTVYMYLVCFFLFEGEQGASLDISFSPDKLEREGRYYFCFDVCIFTGATIALQYSSFVNSKSIFDNFKKLQEKDEAVSYSMKLFDRCFFVFPPTEVADDDYL